MQVEQPTVIECAKGTDMQIVKGNKDSVVLSVASSSIKVMDSTGATSAVKTLAFSSTPISIGKNNRRVWRNAQYLF